MPAGIIRPLEDRDLPRLAALVRALNVSDSYDPALGPDADALRTAYLPPIPGARCLVADGGTALLGYLTLHVTYETTYASRGAYVGDIFVQPEHRRRGIGRALLGAAARIVRADGGGHLWWTSLPGNADGQAFYARLGADHEEVVAHAVSGDAFERLAAEHPA